MSLNIAGTVLTSNVNNLDIIYGGNNIQRFTNAGVLRRNISLTPMFYAGGSQAIWATLPASTWVTLVFDIVAQNNRSCYSTTTGRFTAPTSGMYLFTGSTYNYQSSSSYLYPMLWINGGSSNKSGGSNYRPKGYMIPAGGYAFDGDFAEIVYLNAGDYAEYREYSANVDGYWYKAYSFFSGVLLG